MTIVDVESMQQVEELMAHSPTLPPVPHPNTPCYGDIQDEFVWNSKQQDLLIEFASSQDRLERIRSERWNFEDDASADSAASVGDGEEDDANNDDDGGLPFPSPRPRNIMLLEHRCPEILLGNLMLLMEKTGYRGNDSNRTYCFCKGPR